MQVFTQYTQRASVTTRLRKYPRFSPLLWPKQMVLDLLY
jgi:hypothetical protein